MDMTERKEEKDLTNSEWLETRIKNSGFKKQFIAEKLGISLNSLNNKISGRTLFTAQEAVGLKMLIGITEDQFDLIFFESMLSENGLSRT